MGIKIENVDYIYMQGSPFERKALDHVNIEIGDGEFIGLIGHTGSGKSTLVQHLNGLLKPHNGRVLINGKETTAKGEELKKLRCEVGLVFQYPEHQLFEETVYKDIAFGPRNMGLNRDEIDRRVRRAAGFVGLSEATLAKSPFELSGGQKRRVAIAGVIAMEPEVLILDEPTAGLDPVGRESILENIRAYQRAQNATIIMVTHSMEEVAAIADRLFVMNHGTVAMQGTPAEIFRRAEELTQIGLDVPQVHRVILELRQLGVDLDPSIFTVEQAVQALLTKKGGPAC